MSSIEKARYFSGTCASGLLAAVTGYATQVYAVAGAEVSKLRHDPTEILTRAIQPAIWLVLFGEVMAQVRGLTSGHTRYLDFLAPGILAQSVLFAAIFYGIAAIWERDLGVLHRYMVSPAPRSALVLGKAVSAGIRGLSQAAVVYLLALARSHGGTLATLDRGLLSLRGTTRGAVELIQDA